MIKPALDGQKKNRTNTRIPILKVITAYSLVGIIWIFSSDWLMLHLLPVQQSTFLVSTAKGIGFILITATALYWLLRYLDAVQQRAHSAEMTNDVMLSRMPQFFAQLPAIVYVLEQRGKNFEPVWVSENVSNILGYSMKELLSPLWWREHLHPDDRDAALAHFATIRVSGGTHEYRIRQASGDYAWIRDELQPIETEDNSAPRIVGVWLDITEIKEQEQLVNDYSSQIQASMISTVNVIAQMVELRDPYTAGHENRVGHLAAAIGAEMGFDDHQQFGLRVAGILHDIGKISVPSELLTKPTRLSHAEYSVIKEHAENGYQILRNVNFPWPVAELARQHHERIDGSGYPRGLKDEEILLEARILSIADVVESMAKDRPYRHSLGLEAALSEIEQKAGTLYDANSVNACLRLFREKNYQFPEGV